LEVLAEDMCAEERALEHVRERIATCRRDIAKMIATRMKDVVAARRAGQGPTNRRAALNVFRAWILRFSSPPSCSENRVNCRWRSSLGHSSPGRRSVSIQEAGKRNVQSYWASRVVSSPGHRLTSIANSRRFGVRANRRPNWLPPRITKEREQTKSPS
jgi:hypothetical protein